MKDDFKNEYDFTANDVIDKAQLEKLGGKMFATTGNVNAETANTGMKFDGGKLLAGILFEDFSHALTGVMEIATFGAQKYARNSWKTVPNALQRYKDALVRHQLAIGRGELYDPESGLLHAAHFAWNALAILEFELVFGAPLKRPPSTNSVTGVPV